MELAKHEIVANGIDPLIPIYEAITETKLEENCSDCRKDMMITLAIAKKNYEQEKEANDTGKGVKMKFPKEGKDDKKA